MSKKNSETKVCKYCKTEIPSGAKVCPHCRKKQGGILKWVIIAIIVLGIIVAVAGGGDGNKPKKVGDSKTDHTDTEEKNNAEESGGSQSEEKETLFRMGEIAELNGVQVVLTDYNESKGSEFNTPEDGNVFVLGEFEITNNSDKEMSVSSALSFEAYADDYALNYSLTALMEKDGNQLDGTIAAGKKLKGWIGWEVPQDYQKIEIHFTDNVWSSNKFVFLIEK